ncbi:uncharacterized protein [Eurosta solidaginis]|uniref:uncharacterized protein isoform X2 n=1 Tax=Eurosta solidaginis TaxID=178769 RepID=UPI0035314035
MCVQLSSTAGCVSKFCLFVALFRNYAPKNNKMMNNGGEPIITVSLERPGQKDLPLANLDHTTRSLLANGGPLTGINMKSSPVAKNFWTELPQMVVVETRFITEQIAIQNEIYSAQTLLPITDNRNASMIRKSFSQISTQTAAPPLSVDEASTVKPDVADAEVTTDCSNPCRSRAIQTTKCTKKSGDIGIQCNIEDDLSFANNNNNNGVLNDENKLSEREEFLIYSREKSIFYMNGRRECMVCGEIEISLDRMLSHLALHWGPSALCHLCGLKFEHQKLMSTHNCKVEKRQTKSKKQRRKSYKQCPIYWCGFVCSSRKMFNEHLRLHDVKQGRACITFTLERMMVLKRPINIQLNASHRCNICKRVCKSSVRFVKHRKRCIASFIVRLKKRNY